jgi:hypothetical protein
MRRHFYEKFITLIIICALLFAHYTCKSSSGRMKSPSRSNNNNANRNSNSNRGGGGVLGGMGDENEFDYEDSAAFNDYYFNQELKNKSNTRRIIPDEQRLMSKLLRGYDTASRPVYNASTPVVIEFGFSLVQIFDMVIKKKTRLQFSLMVYTNAGG